jgi:hypothetical protein
MDQSESPLYFCTMCPPFNHHRAPISCVHLSMYPHNLMNWHTVLQWSQPRATMPLYVNTGIYSQTNEANCTTLPEMPDIVSYYHMYVHGTYCMYMYILTERCNFLLALSLISLTCSECILLPPRHTYVSDPIHTGFFVLRTYALWNNNRNLLIAMLSTLFVSPTPSSHPSPILINRSGCHRIILYHHFYSYCDLILFVLSPSLAIIRTYSFRFHSFG